MIWWPVSAAALVAISYWLSRQRPSWRRHAGRLVLALLAPVLLLEGLVPGCAIDPRGERRYWYGFGPTVAILTIVPASALMLALGAFAARWPKRG